MKRLIILLMLTSVLLAGCKAVAPDSTLWLCADGHLDTNENGICDFCQASVLTTFDLYVINDLHGKAADGENHPGVDELTTYLKAAMQTDDNVILLSTGDMWQGSAESNMTDGLLVTDWMNSLGFSAMTMGNHEYDWGEDAIIKNRELAEFPFLAINIFDRDTDQRVSYCDSSVVVEFDGIQVGIIGAIGDCYSSIAQDKVEDVYFKTGTELTKLVMAESDRLREAGADFIVYCLHDGYGDSTSTSVLSENKMASYYDVVLSQGYVDLVFEGHTHQQYCLMDVNGVYHLQNRGDNRGGISHVEVSVNTVTGSHEISQRELISTQEYSSMADDPIVNDLLDKYAEQIAPANRVLGTNRMLRSSDFMRQLVADLYYALGAQTWGGDYDIVLGGGYMSIRSPYQLPAGEVTYAQLQSLFPFDNDLVLCSVKGQDLLDKFINTSNDKYFICADLDMALDIEPDGTYYIVVDTYTSSYAPNRLTVVEQYRSGIYARDLLAEYIENGGLSG